MARTPSPLTRQLLGAIAGLALLAGLYPISSRYRAALNVEQSTPAPPRMLAAASPGPASVARLSVPLFPQLTELIQYDLVIRPRRLEIHMGTGRY